MLETIRIVFLFFVAITIPNCISVKKDDMKISATYYYNGIQDSKTVPADFTHKMTEQVIQLVGEIDDMYKNIVTEDKIEEVKKNNECIEVVFPNAINAHFSWSKEVTFKKILFTLPRDKEKQSEIMIYLGDKVYFSPTYSSSKGSIIAEEIKKDLF